MRLSIILEITRIGNFQKVTAVDEISGKEVSFMAPLNAMRSDIEKLARAKLLYVLNRKSAES
jgi:hypothetical protein